MRQNYGWERLVTYFWKIRKKFGETDKFSGLEFRLYWQSLGLEYFTKSMGLGLESYGLHCIPGGIRCTNADLQVIYVCKH